ncbi:MAG: DUF3996 domain-containing protein [Treponema sp.]|jgi:hypothetical protein|nr:DUF3996 domain-containing protein [Treponema sp.]
MKKLFAVCIIGLALGRGAFANHPDGWGVGLVGRGGWSGEGQGGVALSLKAPKLPTYWGITLDLYNHYFGLGVTGDYYFLEGLLAPVSGNDGFGYFIGLGGYAGFGKYSSDDPTYNRWGWTSIGLGARVPIGVNVVIPISAIKLEVFADVAPHIGLGMYFNDGDRQDRRKDFLGLQWGVTGELGVRVWF